MGQTEITSDSDNPEESGLGGRKQGQKEYSGCEEESLGAFGGGAWPSLRKEYGGLPGGDSV